MHATSLELMRSLLATLYFPRGSTVLDCGSCIANTGIQTSYRDMCETKGMVYTGFDAENGPNVDIVGDIYALSPLTYAKAFDLVISGQLLEHLEFPLLAVQQMKAAVKVGGYIILIAPWEYGEHRYPIDCWRVFPDAMRFLLEGFDNIQAGRSNKDCWGMARRSIGYKAPWKISRS
jgi:SAM-dependent methyltransferase